VSCRINLLGFQKTVTNWLSATKIIVRLASENISRIKFGPDEDAVVKSSLQSLQLINGSVFTNLRRVFTRK
jgi:hypothetical protein